VLSDPEVLVVGLGPAGACAATAAARAGTTVLAIERRRRIGWPVQCAELVPRALAGEAVRRATLQPVSGLETVVEDQPAEVRNDPGRVIDRARFDVLLAEAAVAAGGGPAVSGPVRVIDTGLRPARWNIAFDQALIELHRGARIPDTIRFLRFPRSAWSAATRRSPARSTRAGAGRTASRSPGGSRAAARSGSSRLSSAGSWW
jgi:choline dehydrogenase-like flavoprotein